MKEDTANWWLLGLWTEGTSRWFRSCRRPEGSVVDVAEPCPRGSYASLPNPGPWYQTEDCRYMTVTYSPKNRKFSSVVQEMKIFYVKNRLTDYIKSNLVCTCKPVIIQHYCRVLTCQLFAIWNQTVDQKDFYSYIS